MKTKKIRIELIIAIIVFMVGVLLTIFSSGADPDGLKGSITSVHQEAASKAIPKKIEKREIKAPNDYGSRDTLNPAQK